jgi:isopentenyl-diphosphate delta-isomerase
MSKDSAKTIQRKAEHLNICLKDDICFRHLSAGFERYRFVHNALPEVDFDSVSVEQEFLGYQISAPLVICAVSGGNQQAAELNRTLALAAEQERIALELGSIRAAFEKDEALTSFKIARATAPHIPIIANIGAAQILDLDSRKLLELLHQISADALAIHLNPLQEALQPEGDHQFKGVSRAIEILKDTIDLPIIVKEVGFGLSSDVLKRLKKIGVQWVDIAGAGGTCWALVESKRIQNQADRRIAEEFSDWGIPTAEAIEAAVQIDDIKVIASGGIDSGMKFTKAIALGASLAGAALAFLQAWDRNGSVGVRDLIRIFRETLRLSIFATGCGDLGSFRANRKIIVKE